ncbi:hypothetical protein ZWY2020_016909 [Hordeum vulgare]|nr:hypothetical protein ZWY2020_016909 [Hordeum vulgare]
MLHRLRLHGHSSFFVLADPTPSPSSPPPLGLSWLLPPPPHRRPLSLQGLFITFRLPTPHALTLAEPLLADLDAFVAAMDENSGGASAQCRAARARVPLTEGRQGGRGRGGEEGRRRHRARGAGQGG